jgi:hypothetical protein
MRTKCSFCGRERRDVSTFFRPQVQAQSAASASTYICDRCIESCHRHLVSKSDYELERVEKQQYRQSLQDSVTETLIRAIVDMKYRDALLVTFAERSELADVDPSHPPQADALKRLPKTFAREHRFLPWRVEDNHLVVAFYNPLHLLDMYDEIVRLAGMPIRPALLDREEVLDSIKRYLGDET